MVGSGRACGVLAPPVTAVRAKATGRLHGSAAAAELPGRLRTLLKIPAGQRVSEWERLKKCPRTDSHLMYMIDIALTTEFAVTAGGARCPVTGADRVTRWSTAAAVVGMAAVASYERAYALVRAHGEAGWTARLVPFTVDGLI